MAAVLVACTAGMLVLAFFPTFMDRVAEGLFVVPQNPTIFDKLRMFWYSLDGSEMAYNLLPSFHCLNSTLCYLGVARRKEIPLWFRIYSLVITILIYASTVYVKQHYVLDIVTGVILAVIAYTVCKKFHWGRMFAPIERLCAKWKGKAVSMRTGEEYDGRRVTVSAYFRVFPNREQGIKGYFDFINTARYSNLKGVTSPKTYLSRIKADGYATSSNYVSSNMSLVNSYGLKAYDPY